MARRKSRGGGGGSAKMNTFGGLMATIFGCVMMLVCLIGFNIIIGQIDTAYTAAGTYTEQVGVTDVMGVMPLLTFVAIMGMGVAALGVAGYVGFKKAASGDVVGMVMAVINGVIATVIAYIMFGIINSQLHTAWVTANATTNIASFSGLLDIMEIWGIVILVTLAGSALANFVGVGVGGYRKVRG